MTSARSGAIRAWHLHSLPPRPDTPAPCPWVHALALVTRREVLRALALAHTTGERTSFDNSKPLKSKSRRRLVTALNVLSSYPPGLTRALTVVSAVRICPRFPRRQARFELLHSTRSHIDPAIAFYELESLETLRPVLVCASRLADSLSSPLTSTHFDFAVQRRLLGVPHSSPARSLSQRVVLPLPSVRHDFAGDQRRLRHSAQSNTPPSQRIGTSPLQGSRYLTRRAQEPLAAVCATDRRALNSPNPQIAPVHKK
ncbi:hypothetical protein EXIGLDRAFT_481914 [Exidia glandulosa HHB12029]|uniref:Uncharacterized protein n=1 Tax=Exidia glandulosa HHB12029 TaxID=1314781 RepID=A0A166BLB1_EXIGL|nr:hypothetical protein EXIGLDRAFT_481914 [Exidia glandulosa HHB12029]